MTEIENRKTRYLRQDKTKDLGTLNDNRNRSWYYTCSSFAPHGTSESG